MREKSKTGMLRLVRNPKAVVGVIISMAGIYWAFKDFHFSAFIESIQQVNLIYILLATFLLWVSVWLRGLRWKWLFKENASPSIASLYRAELIGYFGNNILPLRLGESFSLKSHFQRSPLNQTETHKKRVANTK